MDERLADWAKALGVDYGSIGEPQRQDMLCELDAVVVHLYGPMREKRSTRPSGSFWPGNCGSKKSGFAAGGIFCLLTSTDLPADFFPAGRIGKAPCSGRADPPEAGSSGS